MRRTRLLLPTMALLVAFPAAAPGATAGVTVTKTTRTWTVTVGPHSDQQCKVLGDLYVPSSAARLPAPAILTTNGFGGSKDDQAWIGDAFAKRGYVVLSYSGLGFGGSGCNIELDDRAWDGKAASQLITWLGRQRYVKKDALGDPRVGMIGGSYGGQVQYATAALDRRLDTIVPIITWNDLSYSLAPNNLARGTQPPGLTAGVPKWHWTTFFHAVGLAQPALHPEATPKPPSTCPGFDPRVCPAYLGIAARGYADEATEAFVRHASVATFIDRIRIPTLIMQGEADTLFNLSEAVATYRGLKARGVPVKLVFQSWGHSHSAPAPGELDHNDPVHSYQGALVAAWFDKYLKGAAVSTGPGFEYFRPWVSYTGSAGPAYGRASAFPVGTTLPLYLSGSAGLVTRREDVEAGSPTFVTPPPGAGSYSETSAVQDQPPFAAAPPSDPPGTFAAFSTPPLPARIDTVGIPTLTVRITDPTASAADPALQTVLFAKLYDVAPDGSVTLVHRLISPVRIADASKPVRIYLPGIVHRWAAGHVLRVVLATSDQAYLGNRSPHVVSVVTDPAAPGVLRLPVLRIPAAFAD
jgi:predicted acyl esterase